MSREAFFQVEMFTGDLVDNRTQKQRQRARDLLQPRQVEMFSQRELAQFGVRARPRLPIAPRTRIELVAGDTRPDEEKERDLRREIQKRTYPLPGLGSEAFTTRQDEGPCQRTPNN